MTARGTVLAVAALVIALLAVGCGGDDESSPTAGADGQPASETTSAASLETSALDRQEFIKQAGKVCSRERKDLIDELDAYLSANEERGVPQEVLFARAVKAILLPTIEAEIAAIRDLGAPSGDEEEVEAILVAQQEDVDEVRERRTVESVEEVEEHFVDASKLLKAYGFNACYNSPVPG